MTTRVAVLQLAIGQDHDENLAHCQDKIAEAAGSDAQIAVLPEFCNYPSSYASREDAYHHAEALDGEFVKGIAGAAKEHGCYVSATVSLRGSGFPQLFNSQLLFGPSGELAGRHDKEVLFGQQNDYIAPGLKPPEVIETDLGRIGLYQCMDGLIPETTRVPALQGAQLLLNALNSCARDEGELHIPVRAAENHVWVAAANKAWYEVPESGRVWAGRSEIVDPHGHVVAHANSEGREEIVHADVDLKMADDKSLTGGGHLFKDRRPQAYGVLGLHVDQLPFYKERRERLTTSSPVRLGVVQAGTLAEAHRLARDAGARVIALPERLEATLHDVCEVAADCAAYVGVSIIDDGEHVGLLLDDRGEIVLRYRPVHPRPGVPGPAGEGFQVADTPFGRIGLMVGRDGLFPESARVLACLGADIIVYPTMWTEEWEPRLGIHERAAENHVNILAAARLDSPVQAGSVLIPVTHEEHVRGPNVTLNRFEAIQAHPGEPHVMSTIVNVADARHKGIFHRTDILAQRRAEHYGALVS